MSDDTDLFTQPVPLPPAPLKPNAAAATKPEKPKETKEERIARQKSDLERKLQSGSLSDTRTRIAYLLNQYPSTRNSDVDLTIRYWKMFHSDEVTPGSITFDSLYDVTRWTTIARDRAAIQNTFGLYRPDEAVSKLRGSRRTSEYNKRRSMVGLTPFVHIYCDESGKSGRADKYFIVGSVWVNDADEHTLKLFRSLNAWRQSLDWQSEIHFTEATAARSEAYKQFVIEALKLSQYVGFKAVVLAKEDVRSRPPESSIYQLYYRLVTEGLKHEFDTSRLSLPRNVVVHKDDDEGSDRLHLMSLRDQLRTECPKVFDQQVDVGAVEAMSSKTNIIMQLADVFTGALNRKLNKPDTATNHKDLIANHVLLTLGIDPEDLRHPGKGDFAKVIFL